MKANRILGVSIVGFALAFALTANAKGKNSQDLLVPYDGSVAGSHLASGRYHVQWLTHTPGATVTFQKGDKVVATAEGTVEDRGKKYSNNAVIYAEQSDGSRIIQEIRFKGSSEVIVFTR